MEVIAQAGPHQYLPWQPTLIMPVGDIQYDGPRGAADLPRLKKFLDYGMERGAWFIGMGDFVDFLSPSNRSRLKMAGLYDTAEQVIDDAATTLEDEILEVLKPTKGRWIGLLQGHHYYVHLDGTTSDTRFARALNTAFLGDCALIRLTFRGDDKQSTVFKMWVHHGHGGSGVLPTAGLNKLYHQKVRYPDVRLFLMGHVPQLGHVKTDGLDVTNKGTPQLRHVDTCYAMTGGFSRSYQQGSHFAGRAQGGYAEKRMMPPAVLGGGVITLTPETITTSGAGGARHTTYSHIDIKASS